MLHSARAPGNPALTVHFPESLPLNRIARQTRKNPLLMLAIALEWPLFVEAVEALEENEDDGFEIEIFVGTYQKFLRLVDLGVQFAPYFRGWMDGMHDRIRFTGADSDDDADVADNEADDPDEDYSDFGIEVCEEMDHGLCHNDRGEYVGNMTMTWEHTPHTPIGNQGLTVITVSDIRSGRLRQQTPA